MTLAARAILPETISPIRRFAIFISVFRPTATDQLGDTVLRLGSDPIGTV